MILEDRPWVNHVKKIKEWSVKKSTLFDHAWRGSLEILAERIDFLVDLHTALIFWFFFIKKKEQETQFGRFLAHKSRSRTTLAGLS